jgi:hypothetical protein
MGVFGDDIKSVVDYLQRAGQSDGKTSAAQELQLFQNA